ncbi:MAG: major facilitator superfamily protein [Gammaproteobacteria bacterium]|nr:major facilitator superfamily protein [Gammaproteobacteria bacterium]
MQHPFQPTLVKATAAARPHAAELTRGYRAWALFILMLLNALNVADRQGLAAVAPALKTDLRLTDTEMGLIQGLAFAIFHSLLGLPLARLAERRSRTRIVAASMAMFACFSALAAQIRGFTALLVCRIGVSIGDAGLGPPVSSLLGDHYPANRRASATTIIWLGAPIGALLGSTIGGWTAQHSNWRNWFIGLAVPAALVALMAWLTLVEPRRGSYDALPAEASGPDPSSPDPSSPDASGPDATAIPTFATAMRFLLSKPAMRHVLLGASFAAIALNGLSQFWPRYLIAVFHIGTAAAGRFLGLFAVVSMASGLALGGFGVAWAAKRDRRWYAWGPAIALALSMPLYEMGFLQPTLPRTLSLLVPAQIALFVFFTPTLTIAQNMVGATMRASSAFTASIVISLVGTGLGPIIVGAISDLVARHTFTLGQFRSACPGGAALPAANSLIQHACTEASSRGISTAMASITVLLLLGSLHFFIAARTIRADLDTQYRAG